jgi:hypothetical protein
MLQAHTITVGGHMGLPCCDSRLMKLLCHVASIVC